MQVYARLGLGKCIRRFFGSPAESLGAIQPELNHFAVQMVSQPPMILRLVSIWPDAFTHLPEKCAKFCCLENFAQEGDNRLKYL